MIATAPPMPISIQPMRLPARRTISAPSVAYKTAATVAYRFETASVVARSPHAMTVSTAPASESTVIKSHTMAVARLELVTAWSLGLALPGPGVEVGRDAQDEQPVEGVQAAIDRVIVGEPGEQALHQRCQQHQHGRPGDRAGPRPGDHREHQDEQRDAAHGEPDGAVRREGRIPPGSSQRLVLEAEHTQACQEDLDNPQQQESRQQPVVAAEGDTAQPSETTGRDFLVPGGGRLATYHLCLLLVRGYAAKCASAGTQCRRRPTSLNRGRRGRSG